MRFPAYLVLASVGLASLLTGMVPSGAQQIVQVTPAPAAKPPSPSETYAAMTLVERIAIQSDLVWTGHYDGIIDGDFGNRSLAAVKAFQKAGKNTETGILNPRERAQLATQAKARQEQVGWRKIDDSTTGVSLGLPAKLVPQASRGKDGFRWASASGDIVIETFRVSGPAVTLASVTAQLRAVAGRKVDYHVQRPGFFVLIGTQGAKKFYIRAHAQDREVRGVTVAYDAAKDGEMQAVTVAISNAFAPFTGRGTIQVGGPVARRKVEYSTGLVVSAAGHILADRQATEGCRIVQVPNVGPADRIADDAASGLALLRVYGSGELHPAAFGGAAAGGNAISVAGIADPEVQHGGSAITTQSVRISGAAADTERTLEPAPPLGFSGAAVTDQRGRLFGVMLHKAPGAAGQETGERRPALVPAATVRGFLTARGVVPAPADSAAKDIKAAVARVICVRS